MRGRWQKSCQSKFIRPLEWDRLGNSPDGIVNLDGCGVLVVSLARRLGRKILCSPIALPAPTYQHTGIAGPHPAGWAQLPTVPVAHFRVNGVAGAAYAIGVHRAAPRRQFGGTLGAPNATLLDPGTFGK